MKKLNQILVLGLTFVLFSISFTNAQGIPASTPDFFYGSSPGVNGRATGNDILDYLGDTYEVSVYEDIGGNAGIGFFVNAAGGPYWVQYHSLIQVVPPILMYVY